ncbi:hypothetical protein PHYSODRAFT_478250, partial [Phytophthora sojae]
RQGEGLDNPYEVDQLTALLWCEDAWSKVSASTIRHCWNHSRLVGKAHFEITKSVHWKSILNLTSIYIFCVFIYIRRSLLGQIAVHAACIFNAVAEAIAPAACTSRHRCRRSPWSVSGTTSPPAGIMLHQHLDNVRSAAYTAGIGSDGGLGKAQRSAASPSEHCRLA